MVDSQCSSPLVLTTSIILTILSILSIPSIVFITIHFIFNRILFASAPEQRTAPLELIKSLQFLKTPYDDIIPFYLIKTSSSSPIATILYAHTNATEITGLLPQLTHLANNLNCDVVAFEYPGFGMAQGWPNERRLLAAIECMYLAIVTNGVPDGPEVYQCVSDVVFFPKSYQSYRAVDTQRYRLLQCKQDMIRKHQIAALEQEQEALDLQFRQFVSAHEHIRSKRIALFYKNKSITKTSLPREVKRPRLSFPLSQDPPNGVVNSKLPQHATEEQSEILRKQTAIEGTRSQTDYGSHGGSSAPSEGSSAHTNHFQRSPTARSLSATDKTTPTGSHHDNSILHSISHQQLYHPNSSTSVLSTPSRTRSVSRKILSPFRKNSRPSTTLSGPNVFDGTMNPHISRSRSKNHLFSQLGSPLPHPDHDSNALPPQLSQLSHTDVVITSPESEYDTPHNIFPPIATIGVDLPHSLSKDQGTQMDAVLTPRAFCPSLISSTTRVDHLSICSMIPSASPGGLRTSLHCQSISVSSTVTQAGGSPQSLNRVLHGVHNAAANMHSSNDHSDAPEAAHQYQQRSTASDEPQTKDGSVDMVSNASNAQAPLTDSGAASNPSIDHLSGQGEGSAGSEAVSHYHRHHRRNHLSAKDDTFSLEHHEVDIFSASQDYNAFSCDEYDPLSPSHPGLPSASGFHGYSPRQFQQQVFAMKLKEKQSIGKAHAPHITAPSGIKPLHIGDSLFGSTQGESLDHNTLSPLFFHTPQTLSAYESMKPNGPATLRYSPLLMPRSIPHRPHTQWRHEREHHHQPHHIQPSPLNTLFNSDTLSPRNSEVLLRKLHQIDSNHNMVSLPAGSHKQPKPFQEEPPPPQPRSSVTKADKIPQIPNLFDISPFLHKVSHDEVVNSAEYKEFLKHLDGFRQGDLTGRAMYCKGPIGIRSNRVVLYGRSLGTSLTSITAANVSRKADWHNCILEAKRMAYTVSPPHHHLKRLYYSHDSSSKTLDMFQKPFVGYCHTLQSSPQAALLISLGLISVKAADADPQEQYALPGGDTLRGPTIPGHYLHDTIIPHDDHPAAAVPSTPSHDINTPLQLEPDMSDFTATDRLPPELRKPTMKEYEEMFIEYKLEERRIQQLADSLPAGVPDQIDGLNLKQTPELANTASQGADHASTVNKSSYVSRTPSLAPVPYDSRSNADPSHRSFHLVPPSHLCLDVDNDDESERSTSMSVVDPTRTRDVSRLSHIQLHALQSSHGAPRTVSHYSLSKRVTSQPMGKHTNSNRNPNHDTDHNGDLTNRNHHHSQNTTHMDTAGAATQKDWIHYTQEDDIAISLIITSCIPEPLFTCGLRIPLISQNHSSSIPPPSLLVDLAKTLETCTSDPNAPSSITSASVLMAHKGLFSPLHGQALNTMASRANPTRALNQNSQWKTQALAKVNTGREQYETQPLRATQKETEPHPEVFNPPSVHSTIVTPAHSNLLCMVLECAFTSVLSTLSITNFLGLSGRPAFDLFRTVDVIGDINIPIHQLHGKDDTIVPYSHALDLRQCINPSCQTELLTIDSGGHNDNLPLYSLLPTNMSSAGLRTQSSHPAGGTTHDKPRSQLLASELNSLTTLYLKKLSTFLINSVIHYNNQIDSIRRQHLKEHQRLIRNTQEDYEYLSTIISNDRNPLRSSAVHKPQEGLLARLNLSHCGPGSLQTSMALLQAVHHADGDWLFFYPDMNPSIQADADKNDGDRQAVAIPASATINASTSYHSVRVASQQLQEAGEQPGASQMPPPIPALIERNHLFVRPGVAPKEATLFLDLASVWNMATLTAGGDVQG